MIVVRLTSWVIGWSAFRRAESIRVFGSSGSLSVYRIHVVAPDQCDTNPQPYTEVLPSDPDYATAVSDAAQRLDMYHSGQPTWQPPWYSFPNRYTYCPDTSDIVNLSVIYADPTSCSPQLVPTSGPVWDSTATRLIMPDIGVPLQPHWVVTDLTQVPGDWYPRRSDWDEVLVQQNFTPTTGTNCATEQQNQAQEELIVQTLQNVTLTSNIRNYALNEIPFGLWLNKSTCNFTNVPTVSQFTSSAQPPKWISQVQPAPTPNSPVYTELPGAAVFNILRQLPRPPSGFSRSFGG